MRKILIITFCLEFCLQLAFSQNRERANSGIFLKRVEYNILVSFIPESQTPNRKGRYNLDSKGDLEKLFFGDINAAVEFYYMPSGGVYETPPSCFRILKDSSDKYYILEIKYISNDKEAHKEASLKYPQISIYEPQITNERRNQIIEQNKEAAHKQYEERLKLYKIETVSYYISDRFAKELHEKMVSFIDNFKAKGIPSYITIGYVHSLTFRTVVDDEVWTLTIQSPIGIASKVEKYCLEIIEDAIADKFNELNYYNLFPD